MNEEEKEKERIFLELQAEIKAGLEAYERGECIPLEEVRERILGSDSEALFDKLQEEINQSVSEMEEEQLEAIDESGRVNEQMTD